MGNYQAKAGCYPCNRLSYVQGLYHAVCMRL